MKRPVRLSAKAIIINNGKLLVTQNRDKDGDWFLLPGGGQENGESVVDALRREVREEIGAEIEIGPLRFVRDYIADHHEFRNEDPGFHQVELMFECQLIGEPKDFIWTLPDNAQVGVSWLPIDELDRYRFYPKALAKLLQDGNDDTTIYLGDVN